MDVNRNYQKYVWCRLSTTDNCDWSAKAPAKASEEFMDVLDLGEKNVIYRTYKCVDMNAGDWKAKLGLK